MDLVFLADVALALILWGATDSWLNTQNGRHRHPYGTEALLLYAAVLAAPLVLRTRIPRRRPGPRPRSACSGYPRRSARAPLSPAVYPVAGVLVYGLCLYAVGVRGKSWFVLCVAVVTVLGAIVVDARTSAGAILAAIPLLGGGHRPGPAQRPRRARPAGPPPRRRARPAHRSASASPASCTTSWPTTCR